MSPSMSPSGDASGVDCRFLSLALGVPLGEFLTLDGKSAQLSPLFKAYYLLRPWVPHRLRRFLQGGRAAPENPNWYLPEEAFSTLRDFVAQTLPDESKRLIHPWPDSHDWCFALSHDVESAKGFDSILAIADLEQSLGFRSAWSFIPHGPYTPDPGVLRELRQRGFEIAVHGYNHDGRLYASRATFRRRARAINAAISEYRAVGFRSPMVHRNLAWLQDLDVEYDASFFDIDPFQAMPGGVGGIWPFVAGRFVELPYTLPQDHTLFVVRGERDDAIWRDKLRFLVRNQGMALMLTHPDYLGTGTYLDVYRRFLEYVATDGGYWHALPRDVARWWRERDACEAAFAAGTPYPSGRASVARLEVDGSALRFRRLNKSPTSCTSAAPDALSR